MSTGRGRFQIIKSTTMKMLTSIILALHLLSCGTTGLKSIDAYDSIVVCFQCEHDGFQECAITLQPGEKLTAPPYTSYIISWQSPSSSITLHNKDEQERYIEDGVEGNSFTEFILDPEEKRDVKFFRKTILLP